MLTAVLALDTVEQAEAVLSGRQRHVRVPMVECPTCDGNPDGLMQRRWPDGGYTCWPCESECDQGRVPDPSWVAAAKPCDRCGGTSGPDWSSPICPDCGGSGIPRIAVTAPCNHPYHDTTRLDGGWGICVPGACIDGRVSAGFVRIEGPLLEVVAGPTREWDGEHPAAVLDLNHLWVYDNSPTGGYPFPPDQLPFLAPDGPDSLIGCWVAKVEVLG